MPKRPPALSMKKCNGSNTWPLALARANTTPHALEKRKVRSTKVARPNGKCQGFKASEGGDNFLVGPSLHSSTDKMRRNVIAPAGKDASAMTSVLGFGVSGKRSDMRYPQPAEKKNQNT